MSDKIVSYLRKFSFFWGRLSVRILMFNILLVFLPIASLLYLRTYEKQLLYSQEQAMVANARISAAALSFAMGKQELETQARFILSNLGSRSQSRIRILDANASVIADSSLVQASIRPASLPRQDNFVWYSYENESFLYSIGSLPFRFIRWLLRAPESSANELADLDQIMNPATAKALTGYYGAHTELSAKQRSVTLYSAVPIRGPEFQGQPGPIKGAILVSQSTLYILQNLYEIRLRFFEVFLTSLGAALLFSIIFTSTITRPLKKLKRQSQHFVNAAGRPVGDFGGMRGPAEIRSLASSLQTLAVRLRSHTDFVETFASDLTHEAHSPLSTIQSATALLRQSKQTEAERQLLDQISLQTEQLLHILVAARELSRLDLDVAKTKREKIELSAWIQNYAQRWSKIDSRFKLGQIPKALVLMAPRYLSRALDEVLDNAQSFCSEEGAFGIEANLTKITRKRSQQWIDISIWDDGPGLAPGQNEAVFKRFYCDRPEASTVSKHVGLGLARTKTIVEGSGGFISANNRVPKGSGALIEIRIAVEPEKTRLFNIIARKKDRRHNAQT